MAATTPEQKRQLPSKEAGIFRSIVKHYESKQYKRGLKSAEQILKKFPEHGETLSMKGLTLNCLDRKEEAYEFVRKGLRLDLKSHVCWHVYGLLYRSDHEYREAIKCYMNALRIDKENIQILRDLSLLQIQMRDLTGFVETRRQLLTLKPGHRNHWIAFAVAHHLVKNYDMTIHVLDAYAKTVESDQGGDQSGGDDQKRTDVYEKSEMLMYKIRVLEEAEKYDEAIALILKDGEAKSPRILDQLSAKEALGRMWLRLGKLEESKGLYEELIGRNPENTIYHDGLFESMGLPRMDLAQAKGASMASLKIEDRRRMVAVYQRLQPTYPKCISFSRRIIDLHDPSDDPEAKHFLSAVDGYVRPWLTKGIPSLFKSLQQLYVQKEKADLIGTLFESYEESLRKAQRLPDRVVAPGAAGEDVGDAAGASTNDGSNSKAEAECAPDILIWVLMYLAQHYDYMGKLGKAIEKVDQAIAHTPTVIELYSVKARIMKHAGDTVSAAVLSDHARQLDLADRYLNSKTVKYLLKDGKVDRANEVAVMFTKDSGSAADSKDPINSLKNLHEMQCLWYEYECGQAHERVGLDDLGKALRQYKSICKHFDDIHEDQFDFHSYCMRKMTLRAYMDMLRFEDGLYAHEYYAKGAWGAVRCFISLFDDPPSARMEQKQQDEEALLAAMTANERKKYRAKQRKAAKQKELVKAEKTAHKAKEEEECKALLFTEDPLEEASKLLRTLQEYQKTPQMTTQILAFNVAIRRKRFLLALQAVRSAFKIDATHPQAHGALVELVIAQRRAESASAPAGNETQNPVVREVFSDFVDEILGGADLAGYCATYLEEHKATSVEHCLAAIAALCQVAEGPQSLKLFGQLLTTDAWFAPAYIEDKRTTHEVCVKVHGALEALPCLAVDKAMQAEVMGKWKDLCAAAYPYSVHFQGKERQKLECAHPRAIVGVASAMDTLNIK